MPKQIDPYADWLGIPPEDQPPSFYRLLGLEEFEEDPEVIDAAGQRVLASVKLRDRGGQGREARRLMAEVHMAMDCLLDPAKKADYDAELDEYYTETGAYEDDEQYAPAEQDDYELEEQLPVAKPLDRGGASTSTKEPAKAGAKKARTSSAGVSPAGFNPLLLAGIAVGALLLLGGLGTAGYFVFLSGDDEAVAQAGDAEGDDKSADTGAGEGEEEGAAAKGDEEEEETGEEETEKGEGQEEGDTPEDATADENPAGEQPATGDGDPAGEDPKPGDSDNKLAALLGGKPKPGDEPQAGDPADQDPSKKPEGEDGSKEPEESKPGEKQAGEKPEEAKKEKPAKPKLRDPFQDLGDSLTLPPIAQAAAGSVAGGSAAGGGAAGEGAAGEGATGEGEATAAEGDGALATIYNDEDELMNMRLEGGDIVLGKAGKFDIRGTAARDDGTWQVNHVDTSGTSQPVGQFTYQKPKLQFAWAGGADKGVANQLRNCSLKLNVGVRHIRTLPLRHLQVLQPLVVQMGGEDGMSVTATVEPFTLTGLPEDEDTVKFEITEMIGPFPTEQQFEPDRKVELGRPINVILGRTAAGLLGFKVHLQPERDGVMKLEARTMLVEKKRGRPVLRPFSLKPVQQQLAGMSQQKIAADQRMADIRKQVKDKKKLQAVELEYSAFVSKLDGTIKAIQDYLQMCQQLHNNGEIHYRIIVELEGYTVVLARTEPPAPKEKEEAKKKK